MYSDWCPNFSAFSSLEFHVQSVMKQLINFRHIVHDVTGYYICRWYRHIHANIINFVFRQALKWHLLQKE